MKRRLILLPILLLSLLQACNFPQPGLSPLGPGQIQTAAAKTAAFLLTETQQAETGTQPGSEDRTPTPTQSLLPSDTATSTLTSTPLATFTLTSTVTPTPIPCNWALYVSDVTYPDDAKVPPSWTIEKTWKLRNIGSCTWTSGYWLVFDHGDQMGAPASQQLTPGTVAPGGTIDVSVSLVSPNVTGTYQGYFKLRASDSSTFGIGADANTAFWVKIKVVVSTLIPPVVAPTVQQVASAIPLAAGATGSTTAACPAGSVATGGGFSVGADVLVYTQAKNGNGWTAVAKNNAAVNRPMVVYAECLTYPSASAVQVNNSIAVSPGGFASQTAVCPAGSIVTGGGYTSSPDGTMWTYASWQNGNGWEVSEMNIGAAAKSFNVYATCLSGAPLATAKINNTGPIPAGGDGFVEVACPAGKVATGGGFGLGTNTLPYFSGFSSGYWRVYVHNSNASVASLLTTVTCLG